MLNKQKELTPEQAAFILGVTRQTIYSLMKRGELIDLSRASIENHIEAKQRELDAMASRLGFLLV